MFHHQKETVFWKYLTLGLFLFFSHVRRGKKTDAIYLQYIPLDYCGNKVQRLLATALLLQWERWIGGVGGARRGGEGGAAAWLKRGREEKGEIVLDKGGHVCPQMLSVSLSLSLPPHPHPHPPPSFWVQYGSSLSGGCWQAISDVMPAVQRRQLNLFSEIPLISIYNLAEQHVCSKHSVTFQSKMWSLLSNTQYRVYGYFHYLYFEKKKNNLHSAATAGETFSLIVCWENLLLTSHFSKLP